MPHDLGIADRLRAAALRVVEVAGWQTRGSATFNPRGSVDHHTAGSAVGDMPSLGVLINGRAGLSGPLCNVAVSRSNVCYVVAAGRANHAGLGGWAGLAGNSTVYGVERENTGYPVGPIREGPWAADQTETAARVHAALIRGRAAASMVCEHKEWAPARKIDAHTISGATLRSRVAYHLANPGDDMPLTDAEKNELAVLIGREVERRLGAAITAMAWRVHGLQMMTDPIDNHIGDSSEANELARAIRGLAAPDG